MGKLVRMEKIANSFNRKKEVYITQNSLHTRDNLTVWKCVNNSAHTISNIFVKLPTYHPFNEPELSKLGGFAKYSVHSTVTALKKYYTTFCKCWNPTLRLKMTATDPAFQWWRLYVLVLWLSQRKCGFCPEKEVKWHFWVQWIPGD